MGTGFEERARDAMRAVTLFTTGDLARRTARPQRISDPRVDPISESRLLEIFRQPESASARELLSIARVLRLRVGWLMDGEGPITPMAGSPLTARVVMILDALPQEKADLWIGIGGDMTGIP